MYINSIYLCQVYLWVVPLKIDFASRIENYILFDYVHLNVYVISEPLLSRAVCKF